jgi:hypothetical protein
MVILGWILDKPLPLLFDPFESIVRFRNCNRFAVLIGDAYIGFVYLWYVLAPELPVSSLTAPQFTS